DAGGQASEITGSATVKPGAVQQRRVSSGNETLPGPTVKSAAAPQTNQGVIWSSASKVSSCLQDAGANRKSSWAGTAVPHCAVGRFPKTALGPGTSGTTQPRQLNRRRCIAPPPAWLLGDRGGSRSGRLANWVASASAGMSILAGLVRH